MSVIETMKISGIIFFLSLCAFNIKAQSDSMLLLKSRNQIYIELLGNNSLVSPASINYARKIQKTNLSLVLFSGIGFPRTIKETTKHDAFVSYTANLGILIRGKYKRNGLWASFSSSIATGKWFYTTGILRDGATFYEIISYHDVAYDFLPGMTYLYQNRAEHFFLKGTAGLKLFASLFSKTYRDVNSSGAGIFPWFGISIGYSW